jgi:hypothetical protein
MSQQDPRWTCSEHVGLPRTPALRLWWWDRAQNPSWSLVWGGEMTFWPLMTTPINSSAGNLLPSTVNATNVLQIRVYQQPVSLRIKMRKWRTYSIPWKMPWLRKTWQPFTWGGCKAEPHRTRAWHLCSFSPEQQLKRFLLYVFSVAHVFQQVCVKLLFFKVA